MTDIFCPMINCEFCEVRNKDYHLGLCNADEIVMTADKKCDFYKEKSAPTIEQLEEELSGNRF